MRQRDERAVIPSTPSNTRRPMMDGPCDHGQSCVKLVALIFGPGTWLKPTPTEERSDTVPCEPPPWRRPSARLDSRKA